MIKNWKDQWEQNTENQIKLRQKRLLQFTQEQKECLICKRMTTYYIQLQNEKLSFCQKHFYFGFLVEYIYLSETITPLQAYNKARRFVKKYKVFV
ncbi:MAG: hypothetical protein R6U52_06005 [Kosmotogaceae bacterium]